MKGIKYLGLLALPLFAACDGSDDWMYHIETPEDQMHIKASTEDLVMTFADEEQDVITFTWGNAADRGPTATIDYDFRIALADNIKSTSLTRVDGNSITFTGEDINDMLAASGIGAGTQVEVTAQVIATVTDETLYRKPETSSITILVTGYAIPSTDMVIVNNAVDPVYNPYITDKFSTSEDCDEVVPSKSYSWTGWFETAKPVSIETLTGEKFVVNGETSFPAPKDGYFKMTANKKSGEISWEPLITGNSTEIYGVGGAFKCAWNWNDDNPHFVPSLQDPEIFEWTGEVVNGGPGLSGNDVSFKMYNWYATSWGGTRFAPRNDWTPSDSTDDAIEMNGGGDKKWSMQQKGTCKIQVNLNLMKIKFTFLD